MEFGRETLQIPLMFNCAKSFKRVEDFHDTLVVKIVIYSNIPLFRATKKDKTDLKVSRHEGKNGFWANFPGIFFLM